MHTMQYTKPMAMLIRKKKKKQMLPRLVDIDKLENPNVKLTLNSIRFLFF